MRFETGSMGAAEGTRSPIRAAEYVRMSTDHQKYSTETKARSSVAMRNNADSRSSGHTRTAARAGCASTVETP
jgi:hypothetical protein